MRLDDIPLPDSAAATGALDVASTFHSPSLLNHCIRSYLWGAAYARLHDMEFDAELLFVAALLHDIGLVTEFDNHSLPFEDAGGQVAWVFGAGAGWSRERRSRTAEIIVKHMWDEVDPADDPEGFLLCIATGLDISGRWADSWPAELRAEVLARYPREQIAEEFIRCITAQATRKPSSSAADAVASDIATRITRNPLDA